MLYELKLDNNAAVIKLKLNKVQAKILNKEVWGEAITDK